MFLKQKTSHGGWFHYKSAVLPVEREQVLRDRFPTDKINRFFLLFHR
jgi:hypothetical protein